ncbi:MAG TPA: DUF6516 family protein [Bryobacteraceae bacterium]|nr:DUF6516 family protein [Bryobacteraceae bacterium]
MGRKKPAGAAAGKVLDERITLRAPRSGATLREEVWQDSDGTVVRYNLAYINPRRCRLDHGRVLGYDNRHGYHHRHFVGRVEPVEFDDYAALSRRFQAEVHELWRLEDEEEEKTGRHYWYGNE